VIIPRQICHEHGDDHGDVTMLSTSRLCCQKKKTWPIKVQKMLGN